MFWSVATDTLDTVGGGDHRVVGSDYRVHVEVVINDGCEWASVALHSAAGPLVEEDLRGPITRWFFRSELEQQVNNEGCNAPLLAADLGVLRTC